MEPNIDYTLLLPTEILMNIFSLLDIKSLRLCMRVCKRFNEICKHGCFYRELNLNLSFSMSILKSLEPYCNQLTKLDLSLGTQKISVRAFNRFLEKRGTNLTHLRLSSCKFVGASTFITINLYCRYRLKELILSCCSSINFELIHAIQCFPEMECIDFYQTKIDLKRLELCLVHMPKLKHINIGNCIYISSNDSVAHVLATYNKQLVSFNFWVSAALSPSGLSYISTLMQLEEIIFELSVNVNLYDNSLVNLAKSCPKLKKVMIHSMNGLLDHDVLAFANYCPLLENIYLDAFSAITVHSCSELLDKCSNLRTMHIRTNLKYTELNVEYWEKKCPSIYIRPFGLRSVIIYFRSTSKSKHRRSANSLLQD